MNLNLSNKTSGLLDEKQFCHLVQSWVVINSVTSADEWDILFIKIIENWREAVRCSIEDTSVENMDEKDQNLILI